MSHALRPSIIEDIMLVRGTFNLIRFYSYEPAIRNPTMLMKNWCQKNQYVVFTSFLPTYSLQYRIVNEEHIEILL
jgi:hypothetical protein